MARILLTFIKQFYRPSSFIKPLLVFCRSAATANRGDKAMARVLLAESDLRVRRMIAGILTDLGHEVRECADCEEANALLPTVPVDVLVSDLVLRDGDGASLVRASLSGGVPAVTLCGALVEADMREMPSSLSLLERPFRFADLQQVAATVAACAGGSARQAA